MSEGLLDETQVIPPAELEEVDLYHAHSFWTKYVFSQDAKIIAIQYSGTAITIGLVGLVLSWLMRLQLGFPDTFSFIDADTYYQHVTMHGMIMVIYLLTALFLGGFGNYLIPLALMRLAGHAAPLAVSVAHVMVTPANICQFYPEYECQGSPSFDYVFPQEAFIAHLQTLQDDPELADYRQLIPDH